MTDKLLKITIVGGGTAGWLAALVLQKEAARQKIQVAITLIESSKIPTIGVGEGTTAVFCGMLQYLEIDEREFLAATDATIKYGIRHRDWKQLGHSYDGPIDDPYFLADKPPFEAGAWLDTYCVAANRSVTEPHLFTYLMEGRYAPYTADDRPIALSKFHHAYHFDQAKVGAYLRTKARDITLIDAQVLGAKKAPDGNIDSLQLDNDREQKVDFVFDCTGFRRALIKEQLGAEWISYTKELPVNRAMPFWLEHASGGKIAPYTLAWAQRAGWLWQIPTYERLGCGYVYADEFVSPDQAQSEIEQALGCRIEPRGDIKIQAGRVANAWIGNCVALGLAASFLEPLEATSIHGTVVQLMLFAKRHLGHLRTIEPAQRDSYNATVARQVDDFRDFINLHYVSGRDDSDFWQYVAQSCISDVTKTRLASWSKKMPDSEDFDSYLDGLPHVEEQLYYPVLDGLGLLNRNVATTTMERDKQLRAHARKTNDFLREENKKTAKKADDHRQFLAKTRV